MGALALLRCGVGPGPLSAPYREAPKHTLGENLFAVHIGPTLRQVRARDDVTVVSARSRYWPFLAETVVKAPGIREVATWNLLLVLRRCPP